MSKSIVCLSPEQSTANMKPSDMTQAFNSAFRVTMSPHEWSWTIEEQAAMARFVLWSMQRIDAISDLSNYHTPLNHQDQKGQR